MNQNCQFCTLPVDRIIDQGFSCVLALRDGYPVRQGHTLIIPRRHIASWFGATPSERMELSSGIYTVCKQLQQEYSPDGIKSGEAAGQAEPNQHVILRYRGDLGDRRGGVRHITQWMGNYKHPDFRTHSQTRGSTVHLTVQETKKIDATTRPFTHYEIVEFVSWEGTKPIALNWPLTSPTSGTSIHTNQSSSSIQPK